MPITARRESRIPEEIGVPARGPGHPRAARHKGSRPDRQQAVRGQLSLQDRPSPRLLRENRQGEAPGLRQRELRRRLKEPSAELHLRIPSRRKRPPACSKKENLRTYSRNGVPRMGSRSAGPRVLIRSAGLSRSREDVRVRGLTAARTGKAVLHLGTVRARGLTAARTGKAVLPPGTVRARDLTAVRTGKAVRDRAGGREDVPWRFPQLRP